MLETPKQLAARVGITERQVRNLIATGKLKCVKIGERIHIRKGAFERFLDENERVVECPAGTKAQGSSGSRNEGAGTSSGPSAAAAASVQLALQTLNKLSSSSRSSSARADADKGHVIPLRSS